MGAGDPLRVVLRQAELVTVCEEARCPNLADCFGRGVATFMILGEVCTRACAFCAVATGTPAAVDAGEPERLALVARTMGLKHVVVTSVDRDDLPDGGSGQFVAVLRAVRRLSPGTTLEVLTPDFRGDAAAVRRIAAERPEVFNHNVETVSRLYAAVRPGADYRGSLALLAGVKKEFPQLVTKSGVMAGLGETDAELLQVFRDLREAGCDVLTLGQYLRPTSAHRPVARFLAPEGFADLKEKALNMGFRHVASGPRVRSSFNAATLLAAVGGR